MKLSKIILIIYSGLHKWFLIELMQRWPKFVDQKNFFHLYFDRVVDNVKLEKKNSSKSNSFVQMTTIWQINASHYFSSVFALYVNKFTFFSISSFALCMAFHLSIFVCNDLLRLISYTNYKSMKCSENKFVFRTRFFCLYQEKLIKLVTHNKQKFE